MYVAEDLVSQVPLVCYFERCLLLWGCYFTKLVMLQLMTAIVD